MVTNQIPPQPPYGYRALSEIASASELNNYRSRMVARFARHTQSWSDDKNAEWVTRHYLSGKLIMAATIQITSLDYASERNLQVVIPYLYYYALLSSMRALALTVPEKEWKSGALIEMSHEDAIKTCIGEVRKISRPAGERLEVVVRQAKFFRELLSYRFPAMGLHDLSQEQEASNGELVNHCRLLAEIAQFNSECLEHSFSKRVGSWPNLELKKLERCFLHSSKAGGQQHLDREDLLRVKRYCKKMKRPWSIWLMMKKGLVEDFFGAYCAETEDENSYSPDLDRDLLLDFQ